MITMRRRHPYRTWAVQSIELKKTRHPFASRWRREESEQAQIILQGRPSSFSGDRVAPKNSTLRCDPKALIDGEVEYPLFPPEVIVANRYPSRSRSRDRFAEREREREREREKQRDRYEPDSARNHINRIPPRKQLEGGTAPLFKDFFPVERPRPISRQQTHSGNSVDNQIVLRRRESQSSLESVSISSIDNLVDLCMRESKHR